jgi:hypothetical protein
MNQRYSDKKSDRDDADARGEHLYDDLPTGRDESTSNPLKRQPGHYAAGADGAFDVTGGRASRPGTAAVDVPPVPGDDHRNQPSQRHENHHEGEGVRRPAKVDEEKS